MVRIILKRTKDDLTEKRDEDGHTPLHYAAHFGAVSIARMLLEINERAAYITDKERGMTPLHVAAWKGKTEMMKLIISLCPGCSGVVDKRGWNFLHFALLTLPRFQYYFKRFRYLYEITDSTRIGYLLDQKDANGITPSHVLDYGDDISLEDTEEIVFPTYNRIWWKLNQNPMFEMTDCYKDSSEVKKKIEEAMKEISSIKVAGKPTYNVFARDVKSKTYKEKWEKHFEKLTDAHLLVAALVATVTFAAALTVPGGYKSDEGSAILRRNSAFKAFVITDSLSFIFSLSAVFFHFYAVVFEHIEIIELILSNGTHLLTQASFFTMVIAFGTGLYAVLEPTLAITTCSLTIIIFIVSFCLMVLIVIKCGYYQ